MDVLSDLLKTIQFKSVVYFKHDFCGSWGMDVPKGNFAQFHLVVRGQCRLELDKGPVYTLAGGDVIIFPTGHPHRILDHKGSHCLSGMEVVSTIMSGEPIFENGEKKATLICGHYELDKTLKHPFYDSLPSFIHINSFDGEGQAWIRNILDMIIRESSGDMPGTKTITTKLAEVLFIKILRQYMEQNKSTQPTFIQAFSEPIVSQTLSLIHEKPAEGWTLEKLSFQVGASRTSLINKFKFVVGKTPMKYLANWRMIKAKELLNKSDDSILAVSAAVGYQSEAAFIRAFKSHFEITPATYRRSGM